MAERAPGGCGHKLVSDVALIAGRRVLLVKYRDTRKYDGQAGWFLPDDYLHRLEHPEESAKRIVQEQTGLKVPRLRLGMIESFGGDREAWHLIFHYVGRIREATTVTPRGNVATAMWFPLDRLPPPTDLAHEGWAADVLKTLQSRT